jgi:hypothetical protein
VLVFLVLFIMAFRRLATASPSPHTHHAVMQPVAPLYPLPLREERMFCPD